MDGLLQAIEQFGSWSFGSLAIDFARLSEPDMIIRLLLEVLLLGGIAFFSGSETALFSLSRLDLQKLRKERNQHSETLHALLDQPRRLILSTLCGKEIIVIAALVNMAGIMLSLYGETTAVVATVLIMAPLWLLVGEMVPRTVAVTNPLSISTRFVAEPMAFWIRLATPLYWLVRGIANRVAMLIIGTKIYSDNILRLDEFRTLVEEVAEEESLNATERTLIANLLAASNTEIVEIMTPRTRTVFIDGELSVPEMMEWFKASRHSRVPVYREYQDNIIGFLHAEEILQRVFENVDLASLKPEAILCSPVVVPLTKKVDEMFDFFQQNRARAAVVLNEFGGVEGFVTIQDVMNFIFGQLIGKVSGQDLYQERDENVYDVPGTMRLSDFNNLTNFGVADPRMTTIGGVVFRHLDRLPRVDDRISLDGIVMTVLEMQGHQIAKLRVVRGAERNDLMLEEDQSMKSVTNVATESMEGVTTFPQTGEPLNRDEERTLQTKQPAEDASRDRSALLEKGRPLLQAVDTRVDRDERSRTTASTPKDRITGGATRRVKQ